MRSVQLELRCFYDLGAFGSCDIIVTNRHITIEEAHLNIKKMWFEFFRDKLPSFLKRSLLYLLSAQLNHVWSNFLWDFFPMETLFFFNLLKRVLYNFVNSLLYTDFSIKINFFLISKTRRNCFFEWAIIFRLIMFSYRV